MQIYPTHEILSYLTNFGHDVTWIVSSEEIKEVQETTFNGARVFVIPCRYGEGLFKVVTMTLYALRRMFFLFNKFKQERYNMIFVRDEIFDGLLALYIKRIYKVPFVFEMSIPVEQSWKARKFYSKHTCFWSFASKIEKYLMMHTLHKADLVLPISRWLKEDLVGKGIDRSKIIPLPEGVDPDRFLNTDGKEIRERYGLEDSRVVVYVGTMDKMRHPDVLIHAFSKVRTDKENVKLLMVGDGTDKSNLEKLADDLGIKDDVLFTGHVPFKEVPNFIAAADVGVSAIPPLDFYKLSSPIKMLEYMAVAKPVVANEEILDQKEVIEESGGGLLVRFESESFADGIIKILDDPDKAKEMGRRGLKWVAKNRPYEVIARELEKRCFKILKR